MADWYVSSAAYATYTAFQTSHAYTVGNLIVPTAPAVKAKWVLRCTTAGTSAASEPSWATTNNATTTSGGAVFTNITGQGSFFWTAAAGDIPTLLGGVGTTRVAAGDRIFVSSDHSESQTGATNIYGSTSSGMVAGYGVIQTLCVNRAGSTPPVVADLTTGAICTVTGSNATLSLMNRVETYHYGMTYVVNGTGLTPQLVITAGSAAGGTTRANYFKNCSLQQLSNTATLSAMAITVGNAILDNTTVQFGNAAHYINLSTGANLTWINTPSAITGAIIPTVLFDSQGNFGQSSYMILRGVDLSALTTAILKSRNTLSVVLLDSCKIASGVTRYSFAANTAGQGEQIELINCYNGTNIISERHEPMGDVTTEFTITLSGGATDDVGAYSHKMVSTATVNKFVSPLSGFWIDMNYTTTGSSKTATVEIISSTTLKDDEIALYLEYQGTSGSSVITMANSLVATVLTTPANVPTSSATWNSSPATPVKQKLQVTFTPQVAGRVRGQVRLGKASTTVYYNPQMVIT